MLAYANDDERGWKKVLELNKSRPSVFNALTDGHHLPRRRQRLPRHPEGSEYFKQLVEEMEYKAAHGIGTLTEEQYRLIFVGVPCYPIFRRFNELFTEWGGTSSTRPTCGSPPAAPIGGFEYDLDRPIESLAEGVLISVRDAMDSMFHQDRVLAT